MKDLLKYSKLWQKKRDELNITADPDKDWLDMQQVLDKHLPQTHSATGGSGASHLAKFFKAGPIAGLSAVAIVATYLVVQLAGPKINKQQKPDILAGKHDTMIVSNTNPHSNITADSAIISKNQTALTDSVANNVVTNNKKTKPAGTLANVNNTANQPAGTLTANKAGHQPNGAAVLNSTQVLNSNKLLTHSNNNQSPISGKYKGGVNRLTQHGAPFIAANTAAKGNNKPGKENAGNGQPGGSNSPVKIDSLRNILPAGLIGDNTQHQQTSTTDKQAVQTGANNTNVQSGLNNADVKKGDNKSAVSSGNNTSLNDSLAKNNPAKSNGRRRQPVVTSKDNKKDKRKKISNSNDSSSVHSSRIDWGILAGVNTSGSFTPKAQNSNIYGSFPIDAYLGLFSTCHFNEKWGINLQLQALNPQKISGGYSHANGSKVDSGKIIQVTDERKAWFVSLPVHIAYKITDNISVKAGPVINIPVKQLSINNSLTPTTINKDTVYYKKVTGQIRAARYDQKINLGLSAGLGLEFGRFTIDATYLKSLSGYHVTSDFGSYKANSGSLQFTIGFKFNKPR
ncbi:outer membrane beta-barrel protein [Mucilaginibacter boryungensis]|uniref:PorT family protein n=1 Tax=Mucilaginibacter boryungensis TaxID=768480 RepID=A0ABR9XIW7_9SPHI|nr:outer membrane beta-barrel protein [Mucilaginibacter boryungensis]MBE9667326.1 PorT family protein [Mucilaginibacter boryungensis]